MPTAPTYLLAFNGGSSSLKFALYQAASLQPQLSGQIQKIGGKESHFNIKDEKGATLTDSHVSCADADAATKQLIGWLKERSDSYPIAAIGHRIVQGGPHHRSPERVTPALIKELEDLTELAPNHLPAELSAIHSFGDAFRDALQVVCFDTSFHRDMPDYARNYPISQVWRDEGLIRYGFHGLSYEYILQQLGEVNKKKIIIAHLGSGCSMVAVDAGHGIDTTMGLTPTGGLIMGTRSGDLDPGLIFYLLRQKKMTIEELEYIMTKDSGLKALSGGSSDVQELLKNEQTDPDAALALTMFCYQAKKFIGALAAALGGLDTIVFTGGVGEHAPTIRTRICDGLQFLGIGIDEVSNQAATDTISHTGSKVSIRVIPTNEEWMIAHHTNQLLNTK